MGRKYFNILPKVILLFTLVILAPVAGCSKAQTGSNNPVAVSNGLVQLNSAASVDIQVKWMTDEKDSLVFDVVMNTHSVNLDDYDLKKLAVLQDSLGNEYRPLSWDAAPGGHHRSGVLTFAVPQSLSSGETKYLRIVIKDIAGISERPFEWKLG